MTTKIAWRLKNLPTIDEIRELVKDKIITQEEAREILFKTGDEKVDSTEESKEEIKFLRKVIDELSKNRVEKTIEIIRGYEPVKPFYWWHGYQNQMSLYSNIANDHYTQTALSTLN